MEDFCDGKAFKSHLLYSVHHKALQIFFYFDELELCNPLGSKTKIHKLGSFIFIILLSVLCPKPIIVEIIDKVNCIHIFVGMFYFTIGNMSPKYRSQLCNIQLVAVAKSNMISKYGMDEILKPFIADVKKLVCFCST